jgi:hypothetical protein
MEQNIPNIEDSRKIFIGKKCRIHILRGESELIFTGNIKDYDAEKIIFIDKFGGIYQFNSTTIQEIYIIG